MNLGGGTFHTDQHRFAVERYLILQSSINHRLQSLVLAQLLSDQWLSKAQMAAKQLLSVQWSTLALSYDHRVVDGADAARFLVTLKERLEGGDFEVGSRTLTICQYPQRIAITGASGLDWNRTCRPFKEQKDTLFNA
jgi:hypothetical protein